MQAINPKTHRLFLLSVLLLNLNNTYADASFIDKVYHPYVQQSEKEFEWRGNTQKNPANSTSDYLHQHRFAYGQSINDNWFAELYLVGEKTQGQSFKITALELEALWQITEQGEYDTDWGMLFELEKQQHINSMEASTALLLERQWQKWVGTANLYLVYEGGGDIDNEFETALALQGRYRYSRALEPALEYYKSDVSNGLGPVLLGQISLGGRKQIRWQAGIIFGLDRKTPDQSFKYQLELEF